MRWGDALKALIVPDKVTEWDSKVHGDGREAAVEWTIPGEGAQWALGSRRGLSG